MYNAARKMHAVPIRGMSASGDFAVVGFLIWVHEFGYSAKSRPSGFQMLEFRDLRSGIWVKILVVVFHRPDVHIPHRQMFPFRVAGWQHLGIWPLADQEFGLGGFGIRPNSEVGDFRCWSSGI